jgi:predicted nucleic acid-binding protein
VAIVVSDTSAVAALAHLELVDVLRALFAEVFVPPAVAGELMRPRGRRPAVDVARLGFVTVRAPADAGRVAELRSGLDAGESEAIALAIELSADWVLIDEELGRRAAVGLGLQTTGVCGILLRAKGAGLIPAVGPLLARLVSEIDFHVGPRLFEHVLRIAGERPGT